jgi:hypothetical protein
MYTIQIPLRKVSKADPQIVIVDNPADVIDFLMIEGINPDPGVLIKFVNSRDYAKYGNQVTKFTEAVATATYFNNRINLYSEGKWRSSVTRAAKTYLKVTDYDCEGSAYGWIDILRVKTV